MMEQKIKSVNTSRYGYGCESALSGKEGIEKDRLLGPDVISQVL